jgi:hypothetical protein
MVRLSVRTGPFGQDWPVLADHASLPSIHPAILAERGLPGALATPVDGLRGMPIPGRPQRTALQRRPEPPVTPSVRRITTS